MSPFSAVVLEAVVLTIVMALAQLGVAGLVAHAGDGCNDETCCAFTCDIAAGNGCVSLCVHVVASSAGINPLVRSMARIAASFQTSHHGLRRKEQPFRPPILA